MVLSPPVAGFPVSLPAPRFSLPTRLSKIMSANHHPSEVTEPIGNFDINKIAEHLSVHRSTVERLLHGGEFGKDWWRKGRKIIIPKENVFAYERRERGKTRVSP